VADGAGQSFTITPAEGYHVADVLVDDGSVGVVASYEFINVVGDHAIAASFARDTTKTITTGEENTATTSTDTGDVTVDIPSGAVVTGPIDWDGIITPPSATTTFAAPTPDSGFDSVTPVIALSVGAGDIPLTFDKAVKITFAGQAGKYVGWSRGGVFTQIPATCDDATNPTLASGSDCKIDVGSDLVVWTKHFTVFVTYTQTPTPAPAPAPASSSGSVGGAIIGGTGGPNPLPGATMVTATAPQAIGQVLGAAVFNFTTNLHLRSQGADVTALQQFLIDAGFSIPGGATGYFGGQTLAAVISYQKAHGITPASGYVGALTRAELNKGAVPTASESSHSSLTTDQANAIISLLQSFNAEANIVAKVKASLGLH